MNRKKKGRRVYNPMTSYSSNDVAVRASSHSMTPQSVKVDKYGLIQYLSMSDNVYCATLTRGRGHGVMFYPLYISTPTLIYIFPIYCNTSLSFTTKVMG